MSILSTRYYHVKPFGLASGATLSKGSYGRYLLGQGLSATNDPLQEHLRESVRRSHYSHLPSRLTSSFVFEKLDDAVFFRDNWRPGMSIYQVRFAIQPMTVHRVCHTAWHDTFPNHELQAHQFWGNPPLYSSNTELFADEDLVVICQHAELNPLAAAIT